MSSAMRQIQDGMKHQGNGRPPDEVIRRVLELRPDERITEHMDREQLEALRDPPEHWLVLMVVFIALMFSVGVVVYGVSALVDWIW